METLSNEGLCNRAQKGDVAARDLLVENNLGFIRRTANRIYHRLDLANRGLCIDQDDLAQEGSIGLLKAISSFQGNRGIKFLSYAAPAIRNTMMDLIRREFSRFEYQITKDKSGRMFQLIRLDALSADNEKLQRFEVIAAPLIELPEKICINSTISRELNSALEKLSSRERTYLAYRFGFADYDEHSLAETARHFHLSESRAMSTEQQALNHLRLLLSRWT